ncbi:cysteine--tRNA ligase [Patescibacteria group bacterium]|nr:cysteine--tRNA ligase [Patescibacteria group bacterium]
MKFFSFLGIFKSKVKKAPLTLFNTLSGKKEVFKPLKGAQVRMYNCGPTVYDYPHIGNFRPYVFTDILRRTLEYNGYTLRQVINITDVGHLTSDADEGEDKVEKKARNEKKRVVDIVKESTKVFFEGLVKLNIKTENTQFPKASDYIKEQIALIETLEERAYTYETSDGIYFDTSRFPDYGKLGNIDVKGLKSGARVEENKEKKHLTDFALWKFSKPEDKRQQEWDSPWGTGFPGWHIECSAMAMVHLGKQIDIHTGGIDHIPIHHNNEIAQTESITQKQFSQFWVHNEFVTIEGQKIAKSLGNVILIKDVEERGFSPLSVRYWMLGAHYKTPINFTWEALEGAQTALFKLHRYFSEEWGNTDGIIAASYRSRFSSFINDDLNTPKAIALIWKLVHDENVPQEDKKATLLHFDTVLGLGFSESKQGTLDLLSQYQKNLSNEDTPKKIQNLLKKREIARNEKEWEKADQLRQKIEAGGYKVEDTDGGSKVRKV